MDIAVKLGKRLKMIRLAAGIEQKDLSQQLNVTSPLLSMYEKGAIKPSLRFYEAFANKFNLSLSHIFVVIENNPLNDNISKAVSEAKEMESLLLSLENSCRL